MATFSTKLVVHKTADSPDVGPLYLTYPPPDLLYEGVRVPTAATSGQFFGVIVGPSEHIFGSFYRVLVVLSGQFPHHLWNVPGKPVYAPGYGEDAFLSQQ
jgi:hypothetical protein